MVKYLLPLLILLACRSSAQDCQTLDKFNVFHGVQFGKPFVDSLSRYFNRNQFKGDNYIEYSLPTFKPKGKYTTDKYYLYENDTVAEKFRRWFLFGQRIFTNLYFDCLLDGRVYRFALLADLKDPLSSGFTFADSAAIVNSKIPPSYNKMTDEIESLFGHNTKQDDKWILDISYTFSRYWECENKEIVLSFTYLPAGAMSAYGLMMTIAIKDKALEKIEKLGELQN
jgi:hypothetical protein